MKKYQDYTVEEIARFDEMHEVLKKYTREVDKAFDKKTDLPDRPYTDEEIWEYNQYRELYLACMAQSEEC